MTITPRRDYHTATTLELIREHLARRPFTPFRVVTSGGQTYDVQHPENAILIRGGLVVAYGDGDGQLPDRVATLSLMHIVGIETAASA